jgi:hypothetical protein
MVKRKKTHNKIAKRRKTKKKWPGEKGQTIKRQSDNKMAKRKRQTIKGPDEKRQTIK